MEIKKLSKHLFWDVNIDKISFEKNKRLIIQRVLNYGFISDWNFIVKKYGIEEIANTAMSLKELDNKTVSFLSLISQSPRENFICYTTQQSIPKQWNF